MGIMSLPMSRTFCIKKRMVKDKILTTHSDAKGSNVLNAKIFLHIQAECSSFSRKKSKIYHVTKDKIYEEGGFNKRKQCCNFQTHEKGYTCW